jgi:hypothetical protein
MLRSTLFGSIILGSASTEYRTNQVVGYWENWMDVVWWDSYIPGNCAMGCATPASLIEKTTPYSYVNYGFSFLTEFPNPDQNGCKGTSDCPVWDGKAIYVAKMSTAGSVLVSDSIPKSDPNSCTSSSYLGSSPGLVSISEICRLIRQGASTKGLPPKRCQLSLGGWSDYAAIGKPENIDKIAKFIGKATRYGFLDGVDLDFEHLTPFEELYPGEFDRFTALINAIRKEFDTIVADPVAYYDMARAHLAWFNCTKLALPSNQQSPYYDSNIKYMQDILANPVPPRLEISWTTRFNAFLPEGDPYNYLMPDSPVPEDNFATDNEGLLIWPAVESATDNINIMAYDGGSSAGPLKLNFTMVLDNYERYGRVKREKITMGFEPGEQMGGGEWEGEAYDREVVDYMYAQGYGGVMIWPINCDPALFPDSTVYCPRLAEYSFDELDPAYPAPSAPVYSKIDLVTGWTK